MPDTPSPRVTPGAGGTITTLARATPGRQPGLGDDEDVAERLLVLQEEVATKMALFGNAGIVKPKQVMDFTKNITYKKVGGQQLSAECIFCGAVINSTGATRVVEHFARDCVMCPPCVREPAQALCGETAGKRERKDQHKLLVQAEQEQALRIIKVQKTEQRQQSIKAGFKSAETSFADHAIARFFYANGINFGAADTKPDSYYREMVKAIQDAPVGYVPPSLKTLAGHLVVDEHHKMVDAIEKRDEDGELSRKFGITYTSDGWDSCDNLPLINSAYILANDGGVYQRSVDTSGKSKNAEYCAALMIEDIYSIGCTKVRPQTPCLLISLPPSLLHAHRLLWLSLIRVT